ncbi:MAG: glycine cleavage system protein H [Firmicutes bacterium]|nr:glycine cleavage system protein H [Bacillota bacterium]
MQIAGYEFPEELYYERNHFWARVDGAEVTVGATDYVQQIAGEILFFQAPPLGKVVAQGKPFASIESGKWVGQVYAPVSGVITAVNTRLEDDPSPINADPYGEGWMVKIKFEDLKELSNLLKPGTPEFSEWFEAELARNA